MNVKINDQTFNAEYLSTPEDLQKGMMGRTELNGCMVFKMGKGHHRFWMEGCLIPLDIVFINKNRISRIHHNCQPCKDDCTERFTGIGDHVVEFPAGTCDGFRIGDKVNLYLGSPENPTH